MSSRARDGMPEQLSMLDKLIYFCLTNKLVVVMVVMGIVGWGILVAPFDWNLGDLPRDPVPVDAIPDIGENQQIVFTRVDGAVATRCRRSNYGYPMTVALLGYPRGEDDPQLFDVLGFSTIYVIFNEKAEFYWSRIACPRKAQQSAGRNVYPKVCSQRLGPDATALGQSVSGTRSKGARS